jgi:hypothetical protein
MAGPLKRPDQFGGRKRPKRSLGGSLPGGTPADDDLGLDVQFKILDRPSATIFEKELVQIGSIGSGRYLEISTDGVKIYSGGKLKIYLQADGDIFVGEDLSDPSKTYFSIFANNQTYNSESMAAGDMLIGDNSTAKANILWDKSAGRLLFRSGASAEAYVDTDGAIVAGAGDVYLDSDGLTLKSGSGTPNAVKVIDGSELIVYQWADVDGGASNFEILCQGKDSSNHESTITLNCQTDDGNPHAGANQVYVMLQTAQNRITAWAEELFGPKVLRLLPITTTQRNALSAVDGKIIYNSTTGKFQGRAGGAWVDLH